MKTIRENPLLFVLCLFLFLLSYKRFPLAALLLVLALWLNRTRNFSVVLVAILLCSFFVPRYNTAKPEITTARAVQVKGSYAILQSGRTRVIYYGIEPLHFDAIYEIPSSFEKPMPSKGVFRLSSENFYESNHVYYSVNAAVLQKEGHTVRAKLQRRIEESDNPEVLNKLLLNISKKGSESFFDQYGFSYAGILSLAYLILQYLLTPKDRNRFLLIINIFLVLLYHAPLLLVQSLVFRLLAYTKLDSRQKTAFALSIVMFLYPDSLISFSFLLPALYRISFLFGKKKKRVTYLCTLFLQSLFMGKINPVQNFLYRGMLTMNGGLWVFGMLSLAIKPLQKALTGFVSIYNKALSFTDLPAISGSMLGAGLVFYFLLCLSLYKRKYKVELWTILFFVFQCGGLFHPFAEFSAINVSQGDCLLFRENFNRANVLIDTGKPSQWKSVDTFLTSKGIRKLDTMIITHADNDHSGNMERVMTKYKPAKSVMTYEKEIDADKMIFYDLNEILNPENENQGSLAYIVKLNGLTYLCMGDCDRKAEETMIRNYTNLHCDVLKLSHHGSDTGSCDDFLDQVQPRLGIISSGPYSIYHHPSPDTIQRLLKRHIPYLDTKVEGDITILCLPFHLNLLITSRGTISFLSE